MTTHYLTTAELASGHYLTVADVADRMSCTGQWVRDKLTHGGLTRYKYGHMTLIALEEVEAWERKRGLIE